MFNNEDDNEDFKPLEDILEAFKKAKKGEPHATLDVEDFEFLIDYFESEGDKENIKLAFDIGMDLYPFSPDLMLKKANWFAEQNKLGQALKILDTLDSISPKNLEALLMRSDIYVDQLETDKAIELLHSSLVDFDDLEKVEILLELSDLYDEEEEFEQVYLTLKQILEINPKHEDALLRICFWADITNMQESAIGLYQTILEEDPFNTFAWYNMGVAYQGLKLYEKANEAYQNCIDIDEQFEYAYRNMGDAYMQLKKYDKAIEVLEKHMDITKPEDLILEAIGLCWEKKKDYTTARKFYREATSLNPQEPELYYKIGITYSKESKWEKAKKAYSIALNMDNNSSVYCISLANTLLQMQAVDEALTLFEKAVQIKPFTKITWQALIKAYYTCGLYDKAMENIDSARLYCGTKLDFDFYEVAVLIQKGKTKAAMLLLENTLEVNPKKIVALSFIDKEVTHHPLFIDIIAKYKRKK